MQHISMPRLFANTPSIANKFRLERPRSNQKNQLHLKIATGAYKTSGGDCVNNSAYLFKTIAQQYRWHQSNNPERTLPAGSNRYVINDLGLIAGTFDRQCVNSRG